MFKKAGVILALDASVTALAKCAVLFGCSLVLSGCLAGKPLIEGYVVDIKNSEALVTEYDPSAGALACNNAVWLGNTPKGIQVGQKVRVWSSAVAESYPAQASGERWVFLASKSFKGSALTEAEAVRRALDDRRARAVDGIPFVTDVQYDTGKQEWRIEFAGGPDGKLDVKPVLIRLEKQ